MLLDWPLPQSDHGSNRTEMGSSVSVVKELIKESVISIIYVQAWYIGEYTTIYRYDGWILTTQAYGICRYFLRIITPNK